MKQFHFTAYDAQRDRWFKGKVSGACRRSVKETLKSLGYSRIKSLEPANETFLEEISPPPVMNKGSSNPWVSKRNQIAGLLVFLGLILFALNWSGLQPARDRLSTAKEVEVLVEGRFHTLPGESARLMIRFPELPYQRELAALEAVQKAKDFQLKSKFRSSRVPSYCELILNSPNLRETSRVRVTLSGTPLRGQVGDWVWN